MIDLMEFKEMLALCGYPQSGKAAGGGGIGLKSVGVLAQSAVPVTLTGSTTATLLAQIAIPANSLGPNGRLRVYLLVDVNNNANNKQVTVQFGGQTILSVNQTNVLGFGRYIDVFNRNSVSSQVLINSAAGSGFGGQVGAATVLNVNTAVLTHVAISAQLGVATDTLTLQAYGVEILNP